MDVTQKEESLFTGIGHFEMKGKPPMSAPISGVIEDMNIHAASIFTLFFGNLKQVGETWEIEGRWQTVSPPSAEDPFVPNVATLVLRKG